MESNNICAMFSTNDNLVFSARVNIYPRCCSFPTSDKNTLMKLSKKGNSAEWKE